MLRFRVLFPVVVLLLGVVQGAGATELVYTPVNPSFGGSPLNGGFLLNAAQAQNKFKEESASRTRPGPLENFEESLVRRVLNNLAGDIADSAFGNGEAGLTEGNYQVGDFVIDVSTESGGDLAVSISDLGTGDQTTIEIPTSY